MTPSGSHFWNDNGYLILDGFFGDDDLVQFEQDVADLLRARKERAGSITIDVLTGSESGRRLLRDVSDAALTHPYKLNDLFLELDSCRALTLNARLVAVMRDLLGGEPLIINSLSFRQGSQQPPHFDTYYMPPPQENAMVVSSICLEDHSTSSGPLTYFPGSHKIPAYRFSNGGLNAIDDEMQAATDFAMAEIRARGLRREEFVGKRGDVFLWHAQLYHGGTPIADESLTRRTLVTHYWRMEDMAPEMVAHCAHGVYMKRGHQPVP